MNEVTSAAGNQKTWKSTVIVVLCAMAFSAGYFVRDSVSAESDVPSVRVDADGTVVDTPIDLGPFWRVWDEINAKYVTSEMPTDEEKLYGAISGLVGSLDDPYSVFLPPVEAELFETDVQGNFEGVGMEIGMRDKVLTVIAPLKGTPAERAGIKAGDQVIEINGEQTFGLEVNEAVMKIRGPKGSEVALTIVREGEEDVLKISIVRDVIQVPVLDSKLRDDGVFVISLYSFTGTSPNVFREALRSFLASGSDRLVLDLRGNPGGYLEAAVDIASIFLPAGKVVAIEDFGGKAEALEYRSKGYDVFNDSLKMAILINEGSASASEILAGALRDHGKAKLIGTKSFGKGSVQELIKITSDTSLKLTIARWLTPNGVSISEEGLTPDIEVDITKEDAEAEKDPQMDAAVEYLSK